ncbi:MAG: sel1 repeat family protein [Gammaproteobacteria bacterium]|nr:sel1 repeat family protein [Gammaproteobacteria bacterium]
MNKCSNHSLSVSILFLTIFLGFASFSVNAEPFNDGMGKYQSGDYAAALKLLRPLAKGGHMEAQNTLGLIFAKGSKDVPIDDKKAAMWFRKAAAQGHTKAKKNLEVMVANGRVPAVDNNDLGDAEEDCDD